MRTEATAKVGKYFNMHCLKCWEYDEELNWLKSKSSPKLCDWSTFLTELPQNFSKVCDDNIRERVWNALNEAPSDKFSFQDWWGFLNDSIHLHGTVFVELALEKMETAAETDDDRLNYRKITENLNKTFSKNSTRKVIVHI